MSRNDFLPNLYNLFFFFVWMEEVSLVQLFVLQNDKALADNIQIFSSFNKSQYCCASIFDFKAAIYYLKHYILTSIVTIYTFYSVINKEFLKTFCVTP